MWIERTIGANLTLDIMQSHIICQLDPCKWISFILSGQKVNVKTLPEAQRTQKLTPWLGLNLAFEPIANVATTIFYPRVTKLAQCTSKEMKDEDGTDDEDGRQCELFALFTHWLLGSGERWYPSFTPFLVQLHDARKTYGTGRKGGEDISTTSKIGRSLIVSSAIVDWDFKWIYYDTNTSPNLLLLNIPTVYRPILQFSPNLVRKLLHNVNILI